ncbi:hypothetical protein GBA52_028560 [Prunus armeniaca]|nr:hypothetical protein GBA52_028560 [Prunus armeniaca]
MGASRSSDPNQDGSDEQQKRSEIYTYEAPWHIYAMNWSVRRDKKYRLAIASLREHDFLRVWRISGEDEESDSSSSSSVELKSLLNGNKSSEFCGPLTSFDWNEAEPKRIGTSSIDTTCTIWDIEREAVDTQLIAHDKEVYDIAWGGVGVFASVSADGSVRVFDLRDKEHSTIIYESSEPDTPWSGWDGTSKTPGTWPPSSWTAPRWSSWTSASRPSQSSSCRGTRPASTPLPGPLTALATSALPEMTPRLSSGTSPPWASRWRVAWIPFWPIQPGPKSSSCSGPLPSPIGLQLPSPPSFRYSEYEYMSCNI